MSVYIEYVIIDNFVLTYMIGRISYRALKTKNSLFRNILSSSIGTACAVVYPFMKLNAVQMLVVRLLLLLVLSFILFYKKSKLPISLAVFLGITFLAGGVFFALGYMAYGNALDALNRPLVDFSLGLIVVVVFLIYCWLKRFIIRFYKNRDIKSNVFKIELEAFGKTILTQGFYDSGNCIYDSKTGLPVVVISFELGSKILGDEAILKILGGQGEQSYKDARYIECRPFASKPQKLWLIVPQKFLLYFDGDKNIHIEVVLGLSTNITSSAIDYGLIFGSALISKI